MRQETNIRLMFTPSFMRRLSALKLQYTANRSIRFQQKCHSSSAALKLQCRFSLFMRRASEEGRTDDYSHRLVKMSNTFSTASSIAVPIKASQWGGPTDSL